jgi:hypothetical protein
VEVKSEEMGTLAGKLAPIKAVRRLAVVGQTSRYPLPATVLHRRDAYGDATFGGFFFIAEKNYLTNVLKILKEYLKLILISSYDQTPFNNWRVQNDHRRRESMGRLCWR